MQKKNSIFFSLPSVSNFAKQCYEKSSAEQNKFIYFLCWVITTVFNNNQKPLSSSISLHLPSISKVKSVFAVFVFNLFAELSRIVFAVLV